MKEDNNEINRRDVLKGLATVPVLGAFWGVAQSKKNTDASVKEQIFKELNIEIDLQMAFCLYVLLK